MSIDNIREPQESYSSHYEHPASLFNIERMIYYNFLDMNPSFNREIVILCIGTDRATGDCLGPLVGSRLKSMSSALNVFGTLEKPVHAANLLNVIEDIDNLYSNPLVVAIDASLGNSNRIGYVNIRKGSLKPGTALNKNLPEVGDFYISAVVNVGGFLDQMVLQNTRLYIVDRMSEIIARSLYFAHLHYDNVSKLHSINF